MEPATLPVQEALTRQSRRGRGRLAPARRKGIPLSPLAVKMQHDLQLAGKSERTQESYLRAVRKFAQFTGRAPDVTTEDDLRRYFLFIKNEQLWEANSLKVAYAGLKFFYKYTCPREWATSLSPQCKTLMGSQGADGSVRIPASGQTRSRARAS